MDHMSHVREHTVHHIRLHLTQRSRSYDVMTFHTAPYHIVIVPHE